MYKCGRYVCAIGLYICVCTYVYVYKVYIHTCINVEDACRHPSQALCNVRLSSCLIVYPRSPISYVMLSHYLHGYCFMYDTDAVTGYIIKLSPFHDYVFSFMLLYQNSWLAEAATLICCSSFYLSNGGVCKSVFMIL